MPLICKDRMTSATSKAREGQNKWKLTGKSKDQTSVEMDMKYVRV